MYLSITTFFHSFVYNDTANLSVIQKRTNINPTNNIDATTVVKDLNQVTIRLSGDSGDGMQLSGTIFSTLSAIFA